MANFYFNCPARLTREIYSTYGGKEYYYTCVLLMHISDNNSIASRSRCEVCPKGCNACLIREKLDPEFMKVLRDIYFKKD